MKKLNTLKKLLISKPTSYRKRQVALMENVVIQSSENDRLNYQNKLLSTRNTDIIYKHVKILNKSASLPKIMISDNTTVSSLEEKVNLLNEFFHSVFSQKIKFNIKDVECDNPQITNFSISHTTITEILMTIDVTKSRGSNGLPPIFFEQTATNMTNALQVIFKNIKRLRKIPSCWKTAAISPIFKKGDRRNVENWRPISLLNIDSKILEKCIYGPLYSLFERVLSKHQHGFVKGKSVATNMLSFLSKIYRALDENPTDEVVSYYMDFSKACDKVPHLELLKKTANIGVGGCLLEILCDYLNGRKQYVKVEKTSSVTLDVTSGVPQGSLLGTLLFCIFINDLPDLLKFSDPYIYIDDLKLLTVNTDLIKVQQDLKSIDDWVKENKMALALDKCSQLEFRGRAHDLQLSGSKLESSTEAKDLALIVDYKLSWNKHIDMRLTKANKSFYLIRRNIAYKTLTLIKLGLYKSLLIPILIYGLSCTNLSRGDLVRLERFQKKVTKWTVTSPDTYYVNQLRALNVLPLPLYLQLTDLLLLSSLDGRTDVFPHLSQCPQTNLRTKDVFKSAKIRTENARGEFTIRTSRIANRIDKHVDFTNKTGLKNQILQLMWNFMVEKYNENNICTWQLACDCNQCRNKWTIF